MMYEVLTEWRGSSQPNGMVSVMYFDGALDIDDVRRDLGFFWNQVKPFQHQSTSYTIATSGRVIDPSNGQTQSIWTNPNQMTASGEVNTHGPVSNSSMVLAQWRTGAYENGRELRGRTFIPGLSVLHLVGGELDGTVRNTIRTAATQYLAEGKGLLIWRRPKDGVPGLTRPVQTASIWNEMAVLRGRRG